jgi:hypothetical protein
VNGSAVLSEGDSFITTLSTAFTIPASASSLTFTYSDPAFDRTASGVNDAFEAALLDDENRPLVSTIEAGRDAFFNITEGSAAVVGANTTVADHTVTVDLSGVPAGTIATLVFRLVNNDTDTGTTATIDSVGLPTTLAPATPVKFFVADAGSDRSAQYTSEGVGAGAFALATGSPSGIASDAAGDTVWEVDQEAHQVDVYSPSGSDEGSWVASDATAPVGISVSGSDLWLVDRATNRVLRYANGAGLRSGTATATTSFALAVGNTSPSDLVTDGSTIWVTDDASASVFVYDVTGTLLGSWKLDADNTAPSGITLNPTGGTDLWVVDRTARKVFDYTTGTTARSGQLTAAGTFNLGAGVTDPEGIADPPAGNSSDLVLTPAGKAQGFTISTFAAGFPSSSGIGPLGIAFPASGGVLVTDFEGNLWRFPSEADDQNVAGMTPVNGFGSQQIFGLATANGTTYMTDRGSGGQIIQLSDDGTVSRSLLSNLGGDILGIAADPIPDINGIQHLFITTADNNTIIEFNPLTTTATVLVSGNFDGVSTDGSVVYAANRISSSIQGFDAKTGQLLFDSGPVPGDVDGTALGAGSLAGYIFANTNDAGVWEINLATKQQTQIADGPTATRGDFIAVTPDGTLLLTQSTEIDRLTPPAGAGFGPFHLTVAASAPNTTVVAGSQILLSGTASSIRESDGFHGQIVGVTVNGTPVDALDAAGNFFAQVPVPVGVSTYTITATDASGQTASTTLTLTGTQASTAPNFSSLDDVTGSFAAGYARTSFQAQSDTLYADIAVQNLGNYPADVPLLVGVTNISDPTVRVLGAAGTTPTSVPYYDFTGLVNGGILAPGAQSGELSLTFAVPDRSRITYDLVFYGVPNRPPAFTSIPNLEAFPGHSYRYAAAATDPDGDALGYTLQAGPAGMTIDDKTGLVTWSPNPEQLGTQTVTLMVSDGRGGSAEQQFTLTTSNAPPDRPPVITSSPVVESQVGVDYLYPVIATDPDGDPLTYTLTTMPAGMVIDPATGRITWTPGADEVGTQNATVQVSDGLGGSATQSFSICVDEAPGNHDPVIVSQPETSAVSSAGGSSSNTSNYSYQVEAIDPDRDTLTYSLRQAPDGMTIDPTTGLITWTAPPEDIGTAIPVVVRVTDGRGGSDQQQYTINVSSGIGTISGTVVDDVIGDGGLNSAMGEVYDATTEITQTSNPSGVWTYGSQTSLNDPGSFTLLTAQPDSGAPELIQWRGPIPGVSISGLGGTYPIILHNTSDQTVQFNTAVFRPNELDLHAGPDGEYAIVRFIAPRAGQYTVSATFDAEDVTPNETDGHVLVNGIDVFSGTISAAVTASYNSPTITLAAGDTVDFAVGVGSDGDYHYGTTGLIASVTALPVGLPGWTVYLDQNQNGRLDPGEPSTVTDAEGNYTFTNLPAGNYTVAEVPQSGWQETAPTSGTYSVMLGDNQSLSGYDFDNHQTGDTSNHNPTITSPPPTSATTNQLLIYNIVAGDPDGDPLTFDLPTAPAGMTIQPTLGVLVWDPTDAQIGTFPVVLRAEDGKGGITLQSFQVTVTAADTPPVITSVPPGPATVGLPYEYLVQAQDAENDPLTYSLQTAPDGMTIDPTTGIISWTPTLAQVGSQHVVVIVDDGRGGEGQQAFVLGVVATSTDTPPTVLFDGRTTAWAGRPYAAMVDATDPDGDPLTYTLITKPDGMTIDATGMITWTPAATQLGPQSVEFIVSDGRTGGDVTRDVTITVEDQESDSAPVIVSTPNLRATVDVEYSLTLQADDENGDMVTWGLVAAPQGMSVDPATGAIRWVPTDDQMGPQAVVVKATDPFGESSTQSFTIIVTCVNLGPTITSTPPTTAAPGAFYFYAVGAIDPENDPLTFSLLSTPPAGMSLDPATGVLHWTPAASDAGTSVQVAIEVDDGEGNLATQSFTIQVATQAPLQPPVITSTPGLSGHNRQAIHLHGRGP